MLTHSKCNQNDKMINRKELPVHNRMNQSVVCKWVQTIEMIKVQQHNFFGIWIKKMAQIIKARINFRTIQSMYSKQLLGSRFVGDSDVKIANASIQLVNDWQWLVSRPIADYVLCKCTKQVCQALNSFRCIWWQLTLLIKVKCQWIMRTCKSLK